MIRIHQNIGALYVAMTNHICVEVIQAVQQLFHETLDFIFCELVVDIEQSRKIQAHIFKNDVKRPIITILASCSSRCHYVMHVNEVFVPKLSQNSNLAECLVRNPPFTLSFVKFDLLQGNELARCPVKAFIHFSISALPDLFNLFVAVYTPRAPSDGAIGCHVGRLPYVFVCSCFLKISDDTRRGIGSVCEPSDSKVTSAYLFTQCFYHAHSLGRNS
mmetsp:Transcript_11563/g.20514  ORF Transcript_11563/g.20514 Transcript_11563/m.20514 type:complete len:217 (+) Transcript_11563:1847-2497(+)